MTARLEVERIVAEFLGDDINARLATVPVDGGDPQPPQIAPYVDAQYPTSGNIAVFSSTVHPWVSERKDPPAAPALYVMTQGPILMMGEPYPQGQIRATSSPVKLVVRYITNNLDSAVARREGCYTLRAVARSLRALSKSYNEPNTTMVRNGISVVLGQDPMEFWPVVESVGNARVSGALVVHYLVRDGDPEF